MCRLAAFPPGFPREEAIAILKSMEGNNRDGVGYAFVIPNGKFTICKYPGSLSEVLGSKQAPKFLAHMPHNGWTIAHLRMATHGENTPENTHPFVAGEWCVAHNGVWGGHKVARMVLGKSVRFEGETDSEVAAHCINVVGPKEFAKADYAGVFLALNRTGELYAIKTSGMLGWSEWRDKFILATELYGTGRKLTNFPEGWHRFKANGEVGGWSGSKAEKKAEKAKAKGKPQTDPVKVEIVHDSRFGANVYRYSHGVTGSVPPGPGEDEPVQGQAASGDDYYLDNRDQRYHKGPPPDWPAEIGNGKHWDDMTEEEWRAAYEAKEEQAEKDRNLPRHPPLPEVTQTTVPKLTPTTA